MSNKHYNKFNLIIKAVDFSYRKIELKRLVGSVLYQSLLRQRYIEQISLKNSYKQSTRIINYDLSFLNQKIMISRPQNRNDYDQLISKTCQILDISDESIYDISKLSIVEINKSIGIINYLTSAFDVIKCLFGKIKNRELLFIIKEIAYIKNTIHYLHSQKIPPSLEYYIAFNSSVQPDAIICELLKTKGVKTYSMQHAVYADQKSKTEEVINYENIVAEYFLAWNTDTKKLILKKSHFNSDKIIVSGSPLYQSISKVDINKSFTKCLILLPRHYYEKESLKLLEDLGKTSFNNIQFNIKFHPESKREKIIEKCHQLNINIIENDLTLLDLLANNKYDFFMSFNTSSYYQCLMHGKHCLRLVYLENDLFNNALTTLDEDNKLGLKGDVGVNYHFEKFYISSMVSIGKFANCNLALHYKI